MVQIISEAFANVGRTLPGHRADALGRCLSGSHSLEAAIALASNAGAHELLADLVAYRSAVVEAADPQEHAARLRRDAAALDRQEERARLEVAELLGRAIFRERRADPTGGELRRQALAAERCADRYQAEAAAKRERAARLDARLQMPATLFDIARPLPA